jgi:hypothetical protein
MSVDFYLAEVIGGYDNTYKWILDDLSTEDINEGTVDTLFTVYVRTYSNFKTQTLKAKPANNNIKQIPLKGEHVLIFKGVNQESTVDKVRDQWYYLPAHGIQSAINSNRLPGIAKPKTNTFNIPGTTEKAGETFKEKTISPLQPYEGDLLIEGRWGNSIRLGSSVENSSEYTLNANWSGENGSPIIILSNKRLNKNKKEFIVEDISKDGSSLYLTSDQELKTLKLNKTLTKSGKYNQSQLIGVADRIILSARSNNLILDSSNRITMNASEVLIGSEQAATPLAKGDVLQEVLQHIISSIEKGVYGGSTYSLPFGSADLEMARIKLMDLQSNKFFIDNA